MGKVVKLKNGGVLLYQRTTYNKSFLIELGFMQGGATEKIPGTTHFLEHMLFNGTSEYSSEQLSEQIKKCTCELNAYTSHQSISITAKGSVRAFEQGFILCSKMLLNNQFNKQALENERQVILQERTRHDSDESKMFNIKTRYKIFNHDGYNTEILGKKSDIRKISLKNLTDRHNEIACQQNLIVSFSGNLSLSKIKKLINKHLVDKLPSKQVEKSFNFLDLPANEKTFVDIKKNDKQAIVLKLHLPAKAHYDNIKSKIGVDYFNNVCNEFQGILYKKLRTEGGLCYSKHISSLYTKSNWFDVYTVKTTKENVNKVIDILIEIAKNANQNGITKTQFENMNKYFKYDDDCIVPSNSRNVSVMNFQYNYYQKLLNQKLQFKMFNNITYNDVQNALIGRNDFSYFYLTLLGDVSKKDVYSIDQINQKLNSKND